MKSFQPFSLLAVILCFQLASGQTQFQKTTGSLMDDLSYQITSLSNGEMVATGSTQGVAGNGKDSYLIKYNRFGEVKWALTFGGTGDETTWDIKATQNNELIAAGTSNSLGTPFSGSTIARADTAGTIIWLTAVYSTIGSVDFYRVMQTSTGEFVATGLVTTSSNQDDVVLCKFSSSGNLLWSKNIGSAQNDEMMGITETGQGHYLMAGLTNDNTGNGGSDFAAIKTDTSGNVIWKKNYGGSSGERLNDVLEINGAYYFTGWSSSAGAGQDDFVLMKTDTAGTVQWTRAYGSPEDDRVFNMYYNSSDSAIVLAGYTNYSSGASNNRNTLLMSADLSGNLNWAKSYGSSGTDGHWPTGLTTNDDEGYYLFGISNSFSTGGDDDLYLIKTDAQGNVACNQKNPQFTQSTIAGWSGTNFGTASNISLMSTASPLTGSNWSISSASECCQLYANAGPDTVGCPSDSVTLGAPTVPGYTYSWMYNGNMVSSQTSLRVSYQDSGSYRLSVTAAGSSCGTAMDTVEVSAHPKPAKPVATVIGPQLTSTQANSYQWFRNGDSIVGATQKTYTAIMMAYYQVMVTNQFGCTNISDSVQAPVTSLDEYNNALGVSLYPNPARKNVFVEFGERLQEVSVRLVDVTGKTILEMDLGDMPQGQREPINLISCTPGVYQLRLLSDEGQQVMRLVVIE